MKNPLTFGLNTKFHLFSPATCVNCNRYSPFYRLLKLFDMFSKEFNMNNVNNVNNTNQINGWKLKSFDHSQENM